MHHANNLNIVYLAPATAKGTRQTKAVKGVQATKKQGPSTSHFKFPEGKLILSFEKRAILHNLS